MKSLIYATVFTLASATAVIPTIAQAQAVNYDASAPRIVSTDIDRNDQNHSITLYTGNRPGSASNKRGIGRVEGISHLQLVYEMPFVRSS